MILQKQELPAPFPSTFQNNIMPFLASSKCVHIYLNHVRSNLYTCLPKFAFSSSSSSGSNPSITPLIYKTNLFEIRTHFSKILSFSFQKLISKPLCMSPLYTFEGLHDHNIRIHTYTNTKFGNCEKREMSRARERERRKKECTYNNLYV